MQLSVVIHIPTQTVILSDPGVCQTSLVFCGILRVMAHLAFYQPEKYIPTDQQLQYHKLEENRCRNPDKNYIWLWKQHSKPEQCEVPSSGHCWQVQQPHKEDLTPCKTFRLDSHITLLNQILSGYTLHNAPLLQTNREFSLSGLKAKMQFDPSINYMRNRSFRPYSILYGTL